MENICAKLSELNKSQLKQVSDFIDRLNNDDDFDRFWQSYPRKIGKTAAKRKWKTLRPPIEEVLIALELQKKTWEDPRFIPHPTTWLNQGRWEDEIEVIDWKSLPMPQAKSLAMKSEEYERDWQKQDPTRYTQYITLKQLGFY